MKTSESTINEVGGVSKFNFYALIRAYKLIRLFVGMKPEEVTDELKQKYDSWRNDEKNIAEKNIAEMVVVAEQLNLLIYQEEVEQQLRFPLFDSDDEIFDLSMN